MTRVYNFGAGPAMLPDEVLKEAQANFLEWGETGTSVLEIGHRTKEFQGLLANLENKLRKLMNIPANYKILFLPGGGQGQFSLIPMNLTKNNQMVDYFITGIWSERAAKYAKRYANVNIVTTATNTEIPDKEQWKLNPKSIYAYYCPNETINGLQFDSIPDTGNVPLVADMTSSILFDNIDISKYGIIFAAAQKILGIAGITLLIIREDLLGQAIDTTPEVFNYTIQAEQKSCLNTIPTFAIYMMDLMVNWINKQGSLESISKAIRHKADKMYTCIDQSNGFYLNKISPKYRSQFNIPFDLPNAQLLELFLSEAALSGLKYLQGHILVGGARASFYHAMPQSGVDKLIAFMQDFAKTHNS